MSEINKGYLPEEIQRVKAEATAAGLSFIYNTDEPGTEEYACIYFVGNHNGKPVVFDAIISTLKVLHSGKLYEIAEEAAKEEFPGFEGTDADFDAQGQPITTREVDEEIEEFMIDFMTELELEDTVKVQESVDFDESTDYGVILDVNLNVESIDTEVIENFIKHYNNGTLKLDETLYSFQHDDDDDEDDA